jgi:hypothetical protein
MTVGSLMFMNKYGIVMDNGNKRCAYECGLEHSEPFYSKQFDEDEIKELIEFLQSTLEDKENEK